MNSGWGLITIGMIAALAANMPRFFREVLSEGNGPSWSHPIWIGVVVLLVLAFRWVFPKRKLGDARYDGLGDLLIHIHLPTHPDSPARWTFRGFISFVMSLIGIGVGPEGAAIEITHGIAIKMRARSARWFEGRRRTDAAIALAAGVSAAFDAPFAAILLPIEMGIGGRTISVAVASLTAFLTSKGIQHLMMDGFFANHATRAGSIDLSGPLGGLHFTDWKQWLGILFVTLFCSIAASWVVVVIRYFRESWSSIFKNKPELKVVLGGVLILALVSSFPMMQNNSWFLLEDVLWGKRLPSEALGLFFARVLSLALVLSTLGTSGIFWPLFSLGGFIGYWAHSLVLKGVPGFGAVAGLAGGAAFWGAVIGAPLSGAVLAFEMSGNINLLIPCLIAGFGARELRRRFKIQTLVDREIEARGIRLLEGRSHAILSATFVKDAMVADCEVVEEREGLSELRNKLVKSRYPFLPVINSQGIYSGLITVDLVKEALESGGEMSHLIEAKDILYRSGFKTPTVRIEDPLTVTAGVFDEIPCIPVLSADGKVQGLLFVHHVRLAYEREVARRSYL